MVNTVSNLDFNEHYNSNQLQKLLNIEIFIAIQQAHPLSTGNIVNKIAHMGGEIMIAGLPPMPIITDQKSGIDSKYVCTCIPINADQFGTEKNWSALIFIDTLVAHCNV